MKIVTVLLLPLVIVAGDDFASSPSCVPMVCSCSRSPEPKADCSGKGFQLTPTGLPSSLRVLVLSNNDLIDVNVTELERLPELLRLELNGNKLSAINFKVHYKLQVLDLSSNNISSVLSLNLKNLPSLKELNLANNKLMSLPAKSFPGAIGLRLLNLKSNHIVSLEPGSLDELTTLEELILSKNDLSSFPKGLFDKLKNLQLLELNKNKFVEIQSLSFHGLDNLKILRLKRNDIRFLMDGAFYGLYKIEEMILDRNKVVNISKNWLYGLTTLKYLSLAHNKIDFITEDAWEFCSSLEALDLRDNKLQILERDFLRMLPKLRHLNLQDNSISHIQDDDTFEEVQLLETLNLDGNQISHTIEDMKAPFRGLSKLRRLSLSGNQIKSIGNRSFIGLNSLERLDVTNNLISTLQENPFARLKKLTEIKINSKSLLCDCYLKWFPLWINQTDIRGCKASCAHPENLKDQHILSIAYESFTCDDFPKPYILQQPETQITLKGDNLTLTCRAASTSSAEMRFMWKIDSEEVDLPLCYQRHPSEERCIDIIDNSFDGKGKDITSQLQLTNLTYDDAGNYQCIVSNSYGATYSDKANITVYVFPQFVITPEDITVSGGSSADLKCAASGFPAPSVLWSKASGSDFPAALERRITASQILASTDKRTSINSFVISDVKAKDMGVYQCTATNPAGSITWNITLSVLEVPRFIQPMESKTVRSGDNAVIECKASGSPKPKLTWTKDSKRLVGTEDRHFFTADNQLLIIVKAKVEDSGLYECTMHNQLGKESQSSMLTVLDSVPSGANYSQTTVIVVIAISCAIFTVIFVWCFVICKERHRRRRRQRQAAGFDDHPEPRVAFSGSYIGVPKFIAPKGRAVVEHPKDEEFDIGEHVRKSLLPDVSVSQTRLNQATGLLTTDLKQKPILLSSESDERDSGTGASKKSNELTTEEDINLNEETVHQQPDEPVEDDFHADNGAGEAAISLSGLDLNAQDLSYADEESSEENSVVSSSNQGAGEALEIDVSMSEASSGSKDQTTMSQPEPEVPFRTFQPNGHRRFVGSSTMLDLSQHQQQQNGHGHLDADSKRSKKRSSALELNGKCYLAIEPEVPQVLRQDEPRAYRGGVGSLPRHGLEYQQALLEASLNSSDCRPPPLPERSSSRSRLNSSRSSLFGSRRRRSLSRSKKHDSSQNGFADPRGQRSSVVMKDRAMFD